MCVILKKQNKPRHATNRDITSVMLQNCCLHALQNPFLRAQSFHAKYKPQAHLLAVGKVPENEK